MRTVTDDSVDIIPLLACVDIEAEYGVCDPKGHLWWIATPTA
jgi:hypothetical protein